MENTVKARSLRVAAAKIAKATGFSRKTIRTAIKRSKEDQELRERLISQIRVGNLDLESSYLTFNGVLPVELPNGIRIVILPDLHAPAHHEAIIWAITSFCMTTSRTCSSSSATSATPSGCRPGRRTPAPPVT